MTEPSEEFQKISVSLESSAGWMEIHYQTDIFVGGTGVVPLSCTGAELPSIAAAALSTLRFIWDTKSGKPLFATVNLVVPPGRETAEIQSGVMRLIPEKMSAAGADQVLAERAPSMCLTVSPASLSLAHLLDAIDRIPDRSAFLLIHPERYRDPETEEPASDQPLSLKEIALRQVNRLLARLSEVILPKNLIAIILADSSRVEIGRVVVPENVPLVALNPKTPVDKPMPSEFPSLLESFREGGWSAVRNHKAYDPRDENDIAMELAGVFQSEGNLSLVWDVVEPISRRADDFTASSQLAMANAAFAAGNREAASRLLAGAFAAELPTSEELFGALSLAYSNNREDLLLRIWDEMSGKYPDSPLTLHARFLKCFFTRDFAEALEVAEARQDVVGAAQCRAFLVQPIDAGPLLEEMAKEGRVEDGLIMCAEESLSRNDPAQAIHWASQVHPDHEAFSASFRLWTRALRSGLKTETVVEFLPALAAAMRLVAVKPTETTIRGHLERLLEDQIEEPLAKVALIAMLSGLVEAKSLLNRQSIEVAHRLAETKDLARGAQDEEGFERFMEAAVAHFPAVFGGGRLFGDGSLHESLKPMVGPRLIFWLASQSLSFMEEQRDLDSCALSIHLVGLCCQESSDPIMDLTLVHSSVERLATFGAAQDARNLAETALENLPQFQPSYLDWRVSQGWSSLAEACLRSGNRMSALRYLCIAFLAHNGPSPGIELLRRQYRMAARIFREFGIIDNAFRCLAIERELLENAGALKGEAVALEASEMLLRLAEDKEITDEKLLGMLARSQELLAEDQASELFPLTSVQANVFNRLSMDRCPVEIVEDFRRRIENFPPNLKGMLLMTAHPDPTMGEVSDLLKGLPDAQDHDYLANQISQALPAFTNALNHSVKTGDRGLFLMSPGAFAQPSLSIKVSRGSGEVPKGDKPAMVRTTTSEGLKSGTFEEVPRYSFRALADISLRSLQDALDVDEAALVLGCQPSSPPVRMLVSKTSAAIPSISNAWSVDNFEKWRARFIDDLYWEKPNPFVPGIDKLKPSPGRIRAVFEGLDIEMDAVPSYLTIAPPSHLFGFAWQLSPSAGVFLGERTNLAVVPSATWLIEARSSPWMGNPHRKAWMGSGKTTDGTLIALREQVEGPLGERGFAISEDTAPHHFSNCELAFVAAHGGTGAANYFRAVGDRVSHFSPAEMAFMLKSCGCVILAVCSGGRSDRQSGNTETLGLVSSLLRAGVRCVIAPPWPLDIEVVRYWLPTFLESMERGSCVGGAAATARNAVRDELDHPCAWGQLHVYGDQFFRLSNPGLAADNGAERNVPDPAEK